MADAIAELLEVVPPPSYGDAKAAIVALAVASVPATPARPETRARVLASMARRGRFGVFADRVARLFDLALPEAERLVATLEDEAAWQPFLVSGVRMIPVSAGPARANAIATFVCIEPGVHFPDHAHRGEETMVVLDGGLRELAEDGAEVWRGEELVREDGTSHELVALPGVPCVAASLVVGQADFR